MPEEARSLDAVLAALERARGAWPGLLVSPAEFESHARALHVHAGDLASRGHELCLAFACSRGDPIAVLVLEREYLARSVRVMARVNPAREFLDDASQVLRERLLVGPGAKIAQYTASGPLGAWLRVAALRTALNLHKAGRNMNELLSASMLDLAAPDGNENERYREVTQAAVDAAFATLSPRARNVLRLSYIEGSSIDQIAALYGTHRATAARWLAAARQGILDHVAEQVRLKLGLSASEARSVLVRLRSQLRVSVLRLLDAE